MKVRNFMEIPNSEANAVRVQLVTGERPCFGIHSCCLGVTVMKVMRKALKLKHKALAKVEYRHDRQGSGGG